MQVFSDAPDSEDFFNNTSSQAKTPTPLQLAYITGFTKRYDFEGLRQYCATEGLDYDQVKP